MAEQTARAVALRGGANDARAASCAPAAAEARERIAHRRPSRTTSCTPATACEKRAAAFCADARDGAARARLRAPLTSAGRGATKHAGARARCAMPPAARRAAQAGGGGAWRLVSSRLPSPRSPPGGSPVFCPAPLPAACASRRQRACARSLRADGPLPGRASRCRAARWWACGSRRTADMCDAARLHASARCCSHARPLRLRAPAAPASRVRTRAAPPAVARTRRLVPGGCAAPVTPGRLRRLRAPSAFAVNAAAALAPGDATTSAADDPFVGAHARAPHARHMCAPVRRHKRCGRAPRLARPLPTRALPR